MTAKTRFVRLTKNDLKDLGYPVSFFTLTFPKGMLPTAAHVRKSPRGLSQFLARTLGGDTWGDEMDDATHQLWCAFWRAEFPNGTSYATIAYALWGKYLRACWPVTSDPPPCANGTADVD